MAAIKFYESDGFLVRQDGQAMTEVWAHNGGWRPFSINLMTDAFPLTAAQAKTQFPSAFAAKRAPLR